MKKISIALLSFSLIISMSAISQRQDKDRSPKQKDKVLDTSGDKYDNTPEGKIKQAKYYQAQYKDDSATYNKYQVEIENLEKNLRNEKQNKK